MTLLSIDEIVSKSSQLTRQLTITSTTPSKQQPPDSPSRQLLMRASTTLTATSIQSPIHSDNNKGSQPQLDLQPNTSAPPSTSSAVMKPPVVIPAFRKPIYAAQTSSIYDQIKPDPPQSPHDKQSGSFSRNFSPNSGRAYQSGGFNSSPMNTSRETTTPMILPKTLNYPQTIVNMILDHTVTTVIMTAFTIYALYSEDVKILFFTPTCLDPPPFLPQNCDDGADPHFGTLSTIAFILFALEACGNIYCKDKYWVWPNYVQIYNATDQDVYTKLNNCIPGSFYFWLDVLSTLTLMLEIPFFLDLFDVDVVNDEITSEATSTDQDTNTGGGQLDQARAGKASRAGARAGRVVRIIRMVRLIRLVKLFKYAAKEREKEEKNYVHGAGGKISPEVINGSNGAGGNVRSGGRSGGRKSIIGKVGKEIIETEESHVGTEMTERTTKKVIVGVLVMLIVIPNLQLEVTDQAPLYLLSELSSQRLQAVNAYARDGVQSPMLSQSWKDLEQFIFDNTDCFNLTYINFNDGEVDHDYAKQRYETTVELGLRPGEYERYRYSDIGYVLETNETVVIKGMFDVSTFQKRTSNFSIYLTTCVIILLGGITMAFTADVNNLVLRPIETMVALVREISDNPLKKDFKSVDKTSIANLNDGMETTLILQTITKIAGLMRVGFGDAGAEIIAKNLSASNSDSMSLLGQGVKIKSIFGFCDIRNFTDTTECLQEEVMLFVNRIAHILHGIVVQCRGAANKNIGDAFLLTWKLNENELGPGGSQEFIGDMALLSLLKNTIEMARHEDFIMNFSAGALAILYERMPGYKCKMGCGLHMGWAVEGAIGSDKKIDATFISPHVNWAEFLESSTKSYGVPILLSEPFYDLLSEEVRGVCRMVDNIKKSASDDVTGLYTYDVNPNYDFKLNAITGSVEARVEMAKRASRSMREKRRSITGPINGGNQRGSSPPGMRRRIGRLNSATGRSTHINLDHIEERSSRSSTSYDAAVSTAGRELPMQLMLGKRMKSTRVQPVEHKKTTGIGDAPDIVLKHFTTKVWTEDDDLIAMRSHMSPHFLSVFGDGMTAFVAGDWVKAKEHFNEMLKLTEFTDGPSKAILDHIETDYGGICPEDWKGYRDMS